MALLKEDGSLDVERISELPLDEYIKELQSLTREQHREYVSSLSDGPYPRVIIKGSLKEDLASGEWVDAIELLKKMIEDIENRE